MWQDIPRWSLLLLQMALNDKSNCQLSMLVVVFHLTIVLTQSVISRSILVVAGEVQFVCLIPRRLVYFVHQYLEGCRYGLRSIAS